MSAADIGRHQLGVMLDRVLPALDRVIAAIPADRLEFRATPENMSAKELAYHVYQVAHALARAVETGRYDLGVLAEVPFDPDAVTSAADLVDYGARVRPVVARVRDGLTARRLDAAIAGGAGPTATGLGCVDVMLQEAIHHRGQLMIYLRLMGVRPPGLYA
jgi:uncharacterized damage-inducible protein DinB